MYNDGSTLKPMAVREERDSKIKFKQTLYNYRYKKKLNNKRLKYKNAIWYYIHIDYN